MDIPTTSGSEIRIPRRAAGGFFCPAGGLFSPLGRGGNVCAPQRGGFCSSWKRGERLRPTFLFLSREKKKCAAPGTKKKSAWSGFREESCSFFVRALRPENGFPGAMRTGFTACAAAADRCGWADLRAGTSGFRCESRFFFLCVYILMVGFLMLCGLVFPLAPLPLTGAGGLAFMLKNLAFHWKTAASYGDRDTVWQG